MGDMNPSKMPSGKRLAKGGALGGVVFTSSNGYTKI